MPHYCDNILIWDANGHPSHCVHKRLSFSQQKARGCQTKTQIS